MSHHLDTPLARQNGQLYIDDLYVFPGDHSTIFIMNVNSNVTEPNVQPGFHHEARYEVKVHDGDSEFEQLTYRVVFAEADGTGTQALQLFALTGDDARDDAAEGTQLLTGRTGEEIQQGDVRLWAGRIVDPFYVDLDQLATINTAVKDGTVVDHTAWTPADAKNSFAGTTVESIVLEVSHQQPQLHAGARIGVWCATKLATDAGGWRQINRFGHPMMWPIFWPHDTDFSNPANERHPSADRNADGKYIADQIAAVVMANDTCADPAGYGQTVAQTLLPDVMAYQVGTPASYGFAGCNGRTLADNAPEVMFSLVLDTAVTSGLGPSVNEHLHAPNFPYVQAA